VEVHAAVTVQRRLPPVKPVKPALPQQANAVAAARSARAADVLKLPAADDKVVHTAAVVTVAVVTVVAAKVVADAVVALARVVHGQPKRSWSLARSPRPLSPKR